MKSPRAGSAGQNPAGARMGSFPAAASLRLLTFPGYNLAPQESYTSGRDDDLNYHNLCRGKWSEAFQSGKLQARPQIMRLAAAPAQPCVGNAGALPLQRLAMLMLLSLG